MDIIKIELEKIKEELLFGFEEPLIDNELQEFLTGPSKYIRSVLTLLYIKSLGCETNPNIIKILSAGEIIHNASLLHDDVIDDAQTRRGKSTNGNNYSSNMSILSGDYLLLFGINKLLEIGNIDIIENFRNCAEQMTRAEFQQFFSRNKKVTEEDYLKICEDKTGLLFSTILKSCATILGLNIESASNFGKIFGIIFQINNDLDDNSAMQDKANGIYTAKDILGIENTRILLDNYLGEIDLLLDSIPNNIYKKRLEDLIKNYAR